MSEEQDKTTSGTPGPTTAAEAPAPLEESPAIAEAARLKEEAAKLKDQLLRTAADFENFRKRSRREVDEARARGRNETLAELLPVFDNLQRAAQHAGTATDAASIHAGIQMVMSQLDAALARVGVTPVETVGKQFDPTRHDAIQQVERDDVEPGTIVEEVQRGYANGERLVRAALVVVARAKAAAVAAPETTDVTDPGGDGAG
ncbi:MAG: nucleotide exchange factor GrpE [Deltaproteobacteria bacterium]|nr:nucleotide exchange factor GrpE [Deltaproteobacteria bacterium]